MNPLQVYNVLEVPAHKDVDAPHSGDGDVLCVGSHLLREHAGREVVIRQFAGLLIELECLDVRLRDRGETASNTSGAVASSCSVSVDRTRMRLPRTKSSRSRTECSANSASSQPPRTEVSA